jgi:hypothetical protein
MGPCCAAWTGALPAEASVGAIQGASPGIFAWLALAQLE